MMAAARTIAGRAGMFWIVPLMGGTEAPRASTAPAAPAAVPAAKPLAAPTAAPVSAPVATPPAAPAPILPARVHFETGKMALSADDMNVIAAVAGELKGSPGVEQNLELAKQRAIAVRDALKSAGVAEDRLTLAKPRSAITGAGADAEARRVEIFVTK